MGSSVPTAVTDEELDRHVAELIVKEAKRKSEQYLKTGIRAYLPDPEYVPHFFELITILTLFTSKTRWKCAQGKQTLSFCYHTQYR